MKVLIAEDDDFSRELLRRNLEKWGHEVVAARDGAEAWDLFARGAFPLVISDWTMPGLDGLELIRRVRASPTPGYVYIILLTARAEKADLVQGLAAGADDFVAKPFDREELRVRVQAGERIVRQEHGLAEQNRALREAQAALVQSEKLASLGRLAAGLAHEINNPIAFVTNNLAVLRRDVLGTLAILDTYRAGHEGFARVEPERAAAAARGAADLDLDYVRANLPRLFEKSLEGLRRVRDIVRNLRDFARLDEAEVQDVDLKGAVGTALEVLGHELREKAIRLETDLPALPPARCHPAKINQVVLNLLLNAIQASRPGDPIAVRTRAEPEAVVVEIEDRGCGISPEHLPHIFEPFFTTKPVGQGMGLGLSVSYGIIRDHGGSIAVDTVPGRGSTFRVRLPLRPPGR
ncbi:MAG TPA: ATP-binding protein [Isosphaeraceae bacterium]